MSDKVSVTFITGWAGYNGGEVAGFDEKTAAELVKDKAAVYTKNVKEPKVDKMATPDSTKPARKKSAKKKSK